MLSFDELIHQAPLIHNERTRTWSIHPELARFLDGAVGPETIALETGSGLSTLVILRKRPRLHIAVQPVADEFVVIMEFAAKHGIATEGFRPVVARSQDCLPTVDVPPIDLVLIDGDHSFPTPFVDWFYTADRLRVGGLMIVDDIHVGTGAILNAFMEADPKWERVLVEPERFAIYRKSVSGINVGDWVIQPFLHDAFPTAGVRLVRASDPVPIAEAVPADLSVIEQLAAMEVRLNEACRERDQALAVAQDALSRIRAMEGTKFWKARKVWFRVRRRVGIRGPE
jgi:predicted O-methyltransferase YrrM